MTDLIDSDCLNSSFFIFSVVPWNRLSLGLIHIRGDPRAGHRQGLGAVPFLRSRLHSNIFHILVV